MDPNPELEELRAQLAERNKVLADALQVYEPLHEAAEELRKISDQVTAEAKAKIAAAQEALQIKVTETREAERKFLVAKRNSAAVEEKIKRIEEEAKRKREEMEAALRRQKAAEELAKQFDTVTDDAPWRKGEETAKPHQIEAGHKIVRDRYVILADPMGLGKTLSSIITADMALAATKEASDEHPYLGQEEQVYVQPQTVWTQKGVDAYMANEWPFGGGPLGKYVDNVTEPGSTPWDEKITHLIRGSVMGRGEKVPYLGYDLQQRLKNEGYVMTDEGHYETQIVNAIKRPVGKRVLYFCPSPLLRNVLEEWRRWAPHRNTAFIGNMSKGERNFHLDHIIPKLDQYTIIVNYEAWRRDKELLTKLEECEFDTIVIDEAHNIKDMKTSAYKGVRQVIDACKPEYVIPMTGTPILNRPQELFSILTLVNPKEFYNERDFLWRYCEEYWPDGSSNPKYRFKPGGLDLLSKKIHTNFLRRTKEQAGIILPEQTIIYHELDLDTETYPLQAKARTHMKEYATIVIDKEQGKAIQASVVIAMITRLRQIETWPAGIRQIDPVTKEVLLQLDVEESQKLDYIIRWDKESEEWEGLIPDVIEDERIVVFSQFKAPLHELRARIEAMGKTAVVFDGDTPNDLKEEIRHDFNRRNVPERSAAKWDVLLANYRAGGTGLNLTAATNIIVCDSEWNPGKRDQAYARVDRIGQTEKSTVNIVNIKNTIDDWLESIMQQKSSVVTGFDNTMQEWSQTLTAADLIKAIDEGRI